MIEPVTTGAALVGAGTWFANKLLGPSADALGSQFKAYASDRLNKIFSKAQTKLQSDKICELPPGFVMQFIQKASFSEDDEFLTEAWANLLANSAKKFDNRQSAFVEILSQLSARDARVLSGLVPEQTVYDPADSMPVSLRINIKLKLASDLKHTSNSQAEAEDEIARLLQLDLGWPGRITAARVHYKADDETLPMEGGRPDQFATYDNLKRLGLIDWFDIDISIKPYETGLEGVLVSMLGIGFLQTCRKIN